MSRVVGVVQVSLFVVNQGRLSGQGAVELWRLSMRVGSWPGVSFDHNPFVHILCAGLEANGATVVEVRHPAEAEPGSLDVLQLHWAEQVFWSSPTAFERLKALARVVWAISRHKLAGTRIVWMVHNLRPHRLGRSERLLWPLLRTAFVALADVILTLSPATAAVVEKDYKLPPGSVRFVRHPSYSPGPTREQARSTLGLDDRTRLLVFFGALRENKGVSDLLTAFRKIDDPTARLHILGVASDPSAIRSLTSGDPRIHLDLRYVERDEIELHGAAADVVVVPIGRQLHSGSLIDALSLGAPVLTPSTPFTRDVEKDLGSHWVSIYEGPLTPERLIFDRPPGRPDMALYAPIVVGRELMAIYRT